jgi:hypothetical protein
MITSDGPTSSRDGESDAIAKGGVDAEFEENGSGGELI